jgi:hypothetical protein
MLILHRHPHFDGPSILKLVGIAANSMMTLVSDGSHRF